MFEEYIKGNSVVHRLDPRVKIIYAFLFSVIIALQNELIPALLGLSIGIVLILMSQIKLTTIIKRILVVNEFILLLWLILPVTYPGTKIFEVFGIGISFQGIQFTTLLTIKTNAIMLILVSLLATSSIFAIVHGLIHLRIPEKLVFLFFLIYRYAHILFDEYERIIRAMKARGFRLKTSIQTYRAIAYLLGCLLIKSYNRAENLYRAMLCRGFAGKFWILDHFKISRVDVVAIILLTLAGIWLIIFKWINPV